MNEISNSVYIRTESKICVDKSTYVVRLYQLSFYFSPLGIDYIIENSIVSFYRQIMHKCFFILCDIMPKQLFVSPPPSIAFEIVFIIINN